MKNIIYALVIFCSCSNNKKVLVSDRNDYITYQGNIFIQSHVTKSIREINYSSPDRIIIYNKEKDTIYLFSTVISNDNMFYSDENIKLNKGLLIISSYYKNFMKDAPHSGIRKFSFIQLLPLDSLIINVDKEKIKKVINDKVNQTKFIYYYFKNPGGSSGDGLVNISKVYIKEKSVILTIF